MKTSVFIAAVVAFAFIGRIHMIKDDSSLETLERPEEAQQCVFCKYFLHYLQETIINPKSEAEIKSVIDTACNKLPSNLNTICIEFVNTHGQDLIVILMQEIVPSPVCSLLKACPVSDSEDIEVHRKQKREIQDKSSCPLCLLVVTAVYQSVINNKTEANIENALDEVCSQLPHNVNDQCIDLIAAYSKEIVEMLLADLTPQEVCTYTKLCSVINTTTASTSTLGVN